MESKAEFQARVRKEHPERFLNDAQRKARTISINKAIGKAKAPTPEEEKAHNQGGFWKYGKFHRNRAYNE